MYLHMGDVVGLLYFLTVLKRIAGKQMFFLQFRYVG